MRNKPVVFIVDDDPDLRTSLTWLIESQDLRVESYPTARAFLDQYDPNRPGCIVLDVCMPEVSGLYLQEELVQRGGAPPIIMITGYGDVSAAVASLKRGAIDFIEKPFSDHAILDSIRHAIEVDREALRAQCERGRVTSLLRRLTPRERQVMELVVAGKANKVIAADLELSQKTVEVHRARVMEKLEVSSLAALVRLRLGA